MKLGCRLRLSQCAWFPWRLCSFLLSLGTSALPARGVGQGPRRVPSQRDASAPGGSGGGISAPPWLLLPRTPTLASSPAAVPAMVELQQRQLWPVGSCILIALQLKCQWLLSQLTAKKIF